jgi:CAAX prenyl protease-like protein
LRCSTPCSGAALPGASLLILPLAVYLGVGMLVGLFGTGFNWAYPLTALVGLALIALWRRRIAAEFAGGPGLSGFAMGFAVFALWLALVPPDPAADAEAAAALAAAPASVVVLWMALRLVGFTLVVPVLEELAFRGGLFRLVTARLTARIGHRGAAGAALAASAIAFGALHSQLLAGTLAGLGFGVLVLRTGRTGDAIIAHAVTNFLLAVSAIVTGHWSLW